MRRVLAWCLVGGALCSSAAASGAAPKPYRLTLGTTAATAGGEVSVRGPAKPLRLYLVPHALAQRIRSRFDPRVWFVGVLSRRQLSVTVPPVDSGVYAVAYWCRSCPQRGRTLIVARARPLRVQMPSTSESCLVTNANGKAPPGLRPSSGLHGNRMLGAFIGDGVYATGADGIAFQKMIWIAAPAAWGVLTVTYQRLDAPEPAKSSDGIEGTLSTFAGRSWAVRFYFTQGCWKVTGRIRDVSLSFVVKVVSG
jgi:hypothetical protein